MMNKETTKIKNFDIATLLSISGILLYSLGWFYWNSFFNTLNIQNSLVELTFEKIISTTWIYSIIVILGFFNTFYYLFETEYRRNYDFFSAIWVLNFSIFMFIFTQSNNYIWIIIFLCTSIILFLIEYVIRRKNIEIGILSKRNFQYFLMLIIYLFSVYYYKNKGEIDASKLYNNYKIDIQLTTKDENEIITGKLISFMEKKYFVMIKSKKLKRIIIINESDVLKAELK